MTRVQRHALDVILPNENIEDEAKRFGDLIVIDRLANRSSSSCECSSAYAHLKRLSAQISW